MRALSDAFMHDLLSSNDGVLHPILERVHQDHTLMLAIRDGYINVYYRGGSILKLSEQRKGSYSAFFDIKYNKSEPQCPALPSAVASKEAAETWVDAFQDLKRIMDRFFSKHPKPERELQQLVARENNYSTISNESEYFISDIEVADPLLGARLDMVALRWLAAERKGGNNCKPAFIEMKYGDGALAGTAGLVKHLNDLDRLLGDDGRRNAMLDMMEKQFSQLDLLGLLKFNRSTSVTGVELNRSVKPEVIFILANHNPRSSQLNSILSDQEMDKFSDSPHFNLRFFVARYAGFGLHADCMVALPELRELLGSKDA